MTTFSLCLHAAAFKFLYIFQMPLRCLLFVNSIYKQLRHFFRCFAITTFDPLIEQPEQTVGMESAYVTFLCACAVLRTHDLIKGVKKCALHSGSVNGVKKTADTVIEVKKIFCIVNSILVSHLYFMLIRPAIPQPDQLK